MKKKLIALLCVTAVVMGMTACGSDSKENKEEAKGEEKKTIRLAAGDPMKEELINAIKGDFEKKGYKLEVSVIEDPIASNNAIEEGSLEANFIQHNAYMTSYNEEHKGDLVAVGDAIYYPCMGVYSNKVKDMKDLTEGMEIGIPRDPTNRSRALRFLEAEGLLKLKEGVEEYSQLEIEENKITAFIGPSGCGKSTLLKSINRMNDLVEGCRIEGQILLDGEDIFKNMDVNLLRKRVGMVFQKANPFPMSIYDNVAYGPRTHGIRNHSELDGIVEKSLRDAAIWDEVKDRLKKSALGLSGGQQQRLCIARALANEPEVLLMDESTSALDPISTAKIEDLAVELKEKYTVIMVTHNMQQAVRVSDKTAFFLLGELVEFGDTDKIFSMPKDKRTEEYITGRFG